MSKFFRTDLRLKILKERSKMAEIQEGDVGEQPPPPAPKEPTFAEIFSGALYDRIIRTSAIKVYHVLKIQKHFRKFSTYGKPPLEVAKLDYQKEAVLGREIAFSGEERKTDQKKAICEESVEDYTEFGLTHEQRVRLAKALKTDLLNRYELVGSDECSSNYVCSFRNLKEARADAELLLQLLPFGAKILEQLGFPLLS